MGDSWGGIGGGTGSYFFESCSGVYNELCGSYALMDADYGRVLDENGKRIDKGEWENALFILTSVMGHAKPDKAICDAGLKAQSVDSGLPFVYGRDDVKYVKCSDEHGVIDDPKGVLKINEKLRLVLGHCDPTCNVHEWYVGVRKGKVETFWPVSARGKAYLKAGGSVMSALPPKANIVQRIRDVRFVPKADSCTATKRPWPHVRFTSKSGYITPSDRRLIFCLEIALN